nr:MAG TPA: hypothetical protein [Caudoviricetes sp.]
MVWERPDITEPTFRKDTMNTVDKFVNEISQNLANAIIEATKYKIFYEETQEKLVEAQTQLERAEAQLARVNKVLEAGEALKELFDEIAEKVEAEKLEKED